MLDAHVLAPTTQVSVKTTLQTGPRVALVNMPFTTSRTPSIQLGLLQAILNSKNIDATSFYFNLKLGAVLGWDVYEVLSDDRTSCSASGSFHEPHSVRMRPTAALI